ncbi:hypothetical protein KEM54_005757 [Ascosphaera aggregata]|nr:hypothetical protein KEM54_005757 [Ascosphaera aggregata]
MHNHRPHPTHRHRNSNTAIATEHNRAPWLDPLFYGEGVAQEKSRQQRAAAAARSQQFYRSSVNSNRGVSPVAFSPKAADAAEAGTARCYNANRSRSYDGWGASGGRRGLIGLAKNRWDRIKSPSSGNVHYTSATGGGSLGTGLLSLFCSPRRLLRPSIILWVAGLLMLWLTYSTIMGTFKFYQEEHLLLRSLDWRNRQRVGGWFGSNKVPEFSDLVFMKEIDKNLLPATQVVAAGERSSRRLVVVGDVHGCLDECGIIGGGPKSSDTVDLARAVSASCVRGYAEDRVLLTRSRIQAVEKLIKEEKEHESETVKLAVLLGEEPGVVGERELAERRLAKELTDEQAEWLYECPVILKVGSISSENSAGVKDGQGRKVEDLGDLVVVHGGLIPGVPLEDQDPSAVMTVRTLDAELHVPYDSSGGINWARMYDKEQQILAAAAASHTPDDTGTNSGIRRPTTVIYGHDLLDKPSIRRFTKGLNTACYLGGRLSALIIEDGGVTSVVSVDCPNRGDKDKGDSKSRAKRDGEREAPTKKRWFFG